uniref:ATP-dependent RNA helicase n=1 Tax=Tetranychus urticae TaxID=32264 RepID=T1K4P1_TETUR
MVPRLLSIFKNAIDYQIFVKKSIQNFFPVQRAAIPVIIDVLSCNNFHRGRDVCVSSPTGSGKTLSFVIPIVQTLINRVEVKLRAIIILPVRDLAQQVYKVLEDFAKPCGLKATLSVGHRSFQEDLNCIIKEVSPGKYRWLIDVLVTTPSRLIDLIHNCAGFDLSSLQILVLDEVDRLLDFDIEYNLVQEVDEAVHGAKGRVPCLCCSTETLDSSKGIRGCTCLVSGSTLSEEDLSCMIKEVSPGKYRWLVTTPSHFIMLPSNYTYEGPNGVKLLRVRSIAGHRLRVTQELAEELDKDYETKLSKDAKLILLVDLDQTLIDTTNEPPLDGMKDVFKYQLMASVYAAPDLLFVDTDKMEERIQRFFKLGFVNNIDKFYVFHEAPHGWYLQDWKQFILKFNYIQYRIMPWLLNKQDDQYPTPHPLIKVYSALELPYERIKSRFLWVSSAGICPPKFNENGGDNLNLAVILKNLPLINSKHFFKTAIYTVEDSIMSDITDLPSKEESFYLEDHEDENVREAYKARNKRIK